MAAAGIPWPASAVAMERDARFEEIVRTYGSKVKALVQRMVGNEGEDLTQEIFLQVYQSLPGFRGDASLGTWLYRIATNRCLDHLRRHGRDQAKVISLDSFQTPEPAAALHLSPEAAAENRDLHRSLRVCLAKLAPELRTLVVLHDLQGLEYREIAAVLGLPLGTVQSRLHRARSLLKEQLSVYLEG